MKTNNEDKSAAGTGRGAPATVEVSGGRVNQSAGPVKPSGPHLAGLSLVVYIYIDRLYIDILIVYILIVYIYIERLYIY